MVQFIPARNDWADAFEELGKGVSQGYINRTDEDALKKTIGSLSPNASPRQILDAITSTRTYSPEAKQTALKNYLGVQNFEELKRHSMEQEQIAQEKNRIAELKSQAPQDRESSIGNYLSQGFDQAEAEALTNPHVPNSVKQGISKRVENEISRGLRQPKRTESTQDQTNQSEQGQGSEEPQNTPQSQQIPLEMEQAETPILEAVEKQVEKPKQEWPDLPLPPETTHAEKEQWRKANQKENNKLLHETKDKAKSHTNALIRYNRLTSLNNSNKLPSGMGRLVINPETGEPYGVASLLGLVNKETQDFVKTMNDFLIDAKTYFGSRVTNFDVQAFKSRLPTLLNTDDGRRMIIEQMKLMEELQIVHDNELEKGLKHYGRNASYSDIQNVVDEKTEDKEAKIINKIDSIDQATNYLDIMQKNPKYKDTTLMQNPETGKFKAFRPSELSEAKARGWIKW